MDLPAALLFASAAIIGLLGAIHLLYTFHGRKLWPRDDALRARMHEVAPVLTRDTTIWKCWIGFNDSHSLGDQLYPARVGWLARAQPALAFGSRYLAALGSLFLLAWLWLAWRYWFRIPLTGIVLSLACFTAAQWLGG